MLVIVNIATKSSNLLIIKLFVAKSPLQAMKIEITINFKEELDYKSLSRRLDKKVDKLIMDHERQQKVFEDEMERLSTKEHHRISETHKLCRLIGG
ncbi:hypothetical protein RYX36_007688 [Vicia faba]